MVTENMDRILPYTIISRLTAVLCIGLVLAACNDDNAIVQEENRPQGTTAVSLTFNTRANEGDIGSDEGIKTLRVIVTDEAGTILYNEKETGLADKERHTVDLILPKTKVRFYAFANEESMGSDFSNGGLEQAGILKDGKILPQDIVAKAWTDESRTHFPKQASEISAYGLPMTGCKGVQPHEVYADDGIPTDLTGKTVEQIEIPLVRCVVKIVVNITNGSDKEALEINTVNFGRFFTDKVYCYMHTRRTLPEETSITYRNILLNPAVNIGTEQTKTVCTLYIYPVSLANDRDGYRYSIALNNENDYKVFLTKNGQNGSTYIPRNSRLTIEGTVTDILNIIWTDLQLVVSCWEDKKMDITFE